MKREDLHEYQEHCVSFLKTHELAFLILEMGLGKSIIALTAILDLMFDSFTVSRVLVIAPLRVCRSVWQKEHRTWQHVSFLKMSVMVGTAKQREDALAASADVYVINRENVKWLVEYLEEHHIPWPFDMVVIDELSSFKNHKSLRWKAIRKVRPKIKRIVGLTGTPASNGLMDLWAEAFLIDEGKRLGRFIGQYREAFFKPGSMNPYTGVVYDYIPLPGAEEKIYGRISDITISMKTLDYLDMPRCLTVNHEAVMDKAERKLYEQMKKELVVDVRGESIDAANAAALSGKLLQMANGAIYSDDGKVMPVHNKKLLVLEDLVEQANGQSVLIAYWFRHDRERIREHLTGLGYKVRELKTEKDITDWNSGRIPVGIISPASAGHGLNIQKGGHILIWFSQAWSLELVQQTNARLWRQGQEETVTIHHIICRDTIDEDVMRAIEMKDQTQERLVEAVKARLYE